MPLGGKMFFNRYPSKKVSQRKNFLREEKGAVAILWGLALIPLIGMLGLTIDIGRDYYVHSVIAGATDAAAVAGAKAAGSGGNATTQATAIFNANIPANFIATISGPSVTVGSNGQTVTVTATGAIPTTFMQILGEQTITATATSRRVLPAKGQKLRLLSIIRDLCLAHLCKV